MTVSTTNSRKISVTNGSTTAFPFDFKLLDSGDFYAVHVATDLTETALVAGTDYDLNVGPWQSGGTLTTTGPLSPLANGTIVMYRQMDYKQLADLLNNKAYDANNLETIFDRMVLYSQQLADENSRALTMSINSLLTNAVVQDPEADAVLKWNAAADEVENGPTTTDLVNAEANAVIATDAAAAAAASAALGLNVDYTTDIATDTQTPNSYRSAWYDLNKTPMSGTTWVSTDTNVPARAGDGLYTDGYVYNGNGDQYEQHGDIYPEAYGFITHANGASPSAGILTSNTTAMQAVINLSYNDATSLGDNLDIPQRTGQKVSLNNFDYHVNSITFPGMMSMEGAGMWTSRIIVHGSITYIKRTDTNFETVWGISCEKVWIRGFLGTEDLIKPGVYSGSADRTDEVMNDCNFHNVIIDHGNFGLDLRGWNNSFTYGIIRDCLRGANLDTAFRTSDPYSGIAAPDDNDFTGTSFYNCDYPYVERFGQGNNLLTCAFYQNDHTAVTIGEYSRGFLMKGGRCEDSIEREVNIQGGQVVLHGGTNYICKLGHTSGASTEPGVGGSWATYWDVTTFWTTERIWITSTAYTERHAYNPSFENVNFLRGPSSRIDRTGNAISRAGTYKYAVLDGDNYSKFETCYAGTFVDANFSITEKSLAANFVHNRDITPSEDGSGSPVYNYLWDNKDYNNQLTKQYGSNEYMTVDKGTGYVALPKLTSLEANSVEITPTNTEYNGTATLAGITDTANNVIGSPKNQAAATKIRTDDVFFHISGLDTVMVQSNVAFDGTQTYTLMVM